MKQLPLNQLGPRESEPGIVDFGILPPWISANDGNRLFVKIIHEQNRSLSSSLSRSPSRCSTERMPITGISGGPRLITPYAIFRETPISAYPVGMFTASNCTIPTWAYLTGIKNRPFCPRICDRANCRPSPSVIRLIPGAQPKQNWKTPALHDLILYELNLAEFSGSLEGRHRPPGLPSRPRR